jgi:ferredoxin--NADP+ reductase
VTVVGRRGPAQATFTTQELRELNTLGGATVLVDPADMTHDAAEEHGDRTVARNLAELRGWIGHEPRPGTIPLRLQFHRRPVRLLGDDRVVGIALERTVVDDAGVASGTGEISVLPADLVVRSVGYRGHPLPGLPVDARTGTVEHVGGRVLRDGQPSPGEYVAGWIKRGPTGVVGTNKHDSHETVASLMADVAGGLLDAGGPVDDLVETLVARGLEPVLLDNWRAIDAAETALGASRGRRRTTLHERQMLLDAARRGE